MAGSKRRAPKAPPAPARALVRTAPHPLTRIAVRPVTLGVPVRFATRRTHLPKQVPVVVRPRPALVLGSLKKRTRGKLRALLALRAKHSSKKTIKEVRVCKCTQERSQNQTRNSRRFYARFGARGTGGGSMCAC